jgi:dienelactone hydrolase
MIGHPEVAPAGAAAGAAADDRRRWWLDWLGIEPAADAGWELGPVTGWRDGVERAEFTVTAHGTTMGGVLLRPSLEGRRLAAVVVPFYDVPSLLGEPTARTRGRPVEQLSRQAYAIHLVSRGVAVLAVPWWFEYVVPASAPVSPLAARYGPSVERHSRTQTGTALGRSIGDLRLALDALTSLSWIDSDRIGVFGHSLGGKLALHLAALDTRIAAGVAHEAGLGWAHSNWTASWYIGSDPPADHDHDELLGLVAPRPFLVAGGGASDGWHNRHIVERARIRWPDEDRLATLHHDAGHTPPRHVLEACYCWLIDQLR